MAETADAKDGDGVAGPGRAVPERVERRDPRAEQRRCLQGLKIIGNTRQRLDRRDHVFGVTAIHVDARRLQVCAVYKISAVAGRALTAMASMPSNPDALSDQPPRDARAE